MVDYGPHKYGSVLHVNGALHWNLIPGNLTVIDIETDEKDNFVGIGLTQNGQHIYYITEFHEALLDFLLNSPLCGHNLKGDAKWLAKWGINIKPEQLYADTILQSYVVNTTKESHSLKDLGKELGYEWPTYQEMVGKGKKKVTLDKQDTETVANYCGMDVLVTYRLYEHFQKTMTVDQMRIYNQIEMPLMRILFEMELRGVIIDVKRLQELDLLFSSKLSGCKEILARVVGKEDFNPNSNQQVAEYLTGLGISLPKTTKGNKKVDKYTLEEHDDLDFVKTLLEYNKIEKLVSTYTKGMLERPSLPNIYTTYNQIIRSENNTQRGISTGRLSSSGPNLQQIPARTEEGQLIRELFIPKEGYVLIDADYSQIEYRLLAHFTKEPVLLEGFKNGEDVHEVTGKLLGCSRDIGKTLNFASIYGAQSKKIAKTAKCSEEDAEKFVQRYWSRLPHVTAWINRIKYEAKQKKGVKTLLGRWIPLPKIDSANRYERMHWERVAVNSVVQGSAAEILKMAMINLKKCGYLPLLTVHDELLFECCNCGAHTLLPELEICKIKEIMESVIKLDVPLIAEVGIGRNWREAKE